jgi:hypothetical protein
LLEGFIIPGGEAHQEFRIQNNHGRHGQHGLLVPNPCFCPWWSVRSVVEFEITKNWLNKVDKSEKQVFNKGQVFFVGMKMKPVS